MAQDLTLPLRRAIVTHLKADGGVVAKVPAARVYGMRTPSPVSWPFTRYGSPDARADGHSSDIDVALHAFSKAADEVECSEILKAMATALNGVVLTLEDGEKAHVSWRRSQIIPDAAEANAWHGIAHFDARIAGCA